MNEVCDVPQIHQRLTELSRNCPYILTITKLILVLNITTMLTHYHCSVDKFFEFSSEKKYT